MLLYYVAKVYNLTNIANYTTSVDCILPCLTLINCISVISRLFSAAMSIKIAKFEN